MPVCEQASFRRGCGCLSIHQSEDPEYDEARGCLSRTPNSVFFQFHICVTAGLYRVQSRDSSERRLISGL